MRKIKYDYLYLQLNTFINDQLEDNINKLYEIKLPHNNKKCLYVNYS